MQYSFTCPLDGCGSVMTVEAQNNNEAVSKLVEKAKEHLAVTHPSLKKTDEEVRIDVASQLTTL